MKVLNGEEIKKAVEVGESHWQADYERYCATDGAEPVKDVQAYVGESIAQAQHDLDMEEFVEWGNETCDLHYEAMPLLQVKRHECPGCWRALEKQV